MSQIRVAAPSPDRHSDDSACPIIPCSVHLQRDSSARSLDRLSPPLLPLSLSIIPFTPNQSISHPRSLPPSLAQCPTLPARRPGGEGRGRGQRTFLIRQWQPFVRRQYWSGKSIDRRTDAATNCSFHSKSLWKACEFGSEARGETDVAKVRDMT